MKNIIVLDTETTNKDKNLAEVIELGVVYYDDNEIKSFNKLYKPKDIISPEVSAVTNITNKMVEDCEYFENCVDDLVPFLQLVDATKGAIVAHNSAYDSVVLSHYQLGYDCNAPWVCTMRFAKTLFINDETVTQYNLPYLRYRFDLDIPENLEHHRASSDAYITLKLFEYLVSVAIERKVLTADDTLLDQIVSLTSKPLYMPRMPFGKHANQTWDIIPPSYIKWALNTLDCLKDNDPLYDVDLSHTIEVVATKLIEEGKL